jgi:hypothetical protein
VSDFFFFFFFFGAKIKREVPAPSLSGMVLQNPQTLLEIGSSFSLPLPRERNNTKWLVLLEKKKTRRLISCKK